MPYASVCSSVLPVETVSVVSAVHPSKVLALMPVARAGSSTDFRFSRFRNAPLAKVSVSPGTSLPSASFSKVMLTRFFNAASDLTVVTSCGMTNSVVPAGYSSAFQSMSYSTPPTDRYTVLAGSTLTAFSDVQLKKGI